MAVFPQGLSAVDARCNAGERRVLHQLKRCLEDDYIVWHDIAIGPRARQPDFIVLSPRERTLLRNDLDEAIEPLALPSLLQVMDLQQEQVARTLGEGHRVIHGSAGSGKTMILVMCFNKAHDFEDA